MNPLATFKKLADQPPMFTFRRTDGSVTWSKLSNLPIAHDLAHYVVETELSFVQSFFGLLDAGFTPDDFVKPLAQRPAALQPANLPPESIQTEHIVNLLQTELLCGSNPNFLDDLTQALAAQNVAFPNALTPDRLNRIRERYVALLADWRALPPGQALELLINI